MVKYTFGSRMHPLNVLRVILKIYPKYNVLILRLTLSVWINQNQCSTWFNRLDNVVITQPIDRSNA
jgi:hypothetical protein